MNLTQTKKGFTIIEVVLVLAIAGLIFLMVFIALPALQSGQRDNARKNDLSLVSTAVTNFTSANRGRFPDQAQLRTALGGTGLPSLSDNTTTVNFAATPPAVGTPVTVNADTINVHQSRTCGDANANGAYTVQTGNTRQFVVVTRLEGNSGSAYCQQGS